MAMPVWTCFAQHNAISSLSMTKDDNKGDISRENLQRYDILFHPADDGSQYDPVQLNSFTRPDHIESVREGLLEMKNVIADCWKEHLHQEANEYAKVDMGLTWISEPPTSAFVQEEQYQIDKKEHSAEWEFANANLVRCLGVAKRARNLLKFPEAEWNFFWRRHVFCLFSDEAWQQPGFNSALDEWSLYGEVTWTGFHDWIESREKAGVQNRTMPKPDLTYAFPVQSPQSDIPKGFARDGFLQTFSLEVLGSLIEQGIACTPTTALRRWLKAPEQAEISDTDRTCFPWAVVEMKRHATNDKASIERCYCQAANGAAAALEMQAQLFQESGQELLSQQPPIVTFTCIGPIVKVWLTYQDEAGPCQTPKRMVCIWTTSVQMTWGVVSLRAIIMNMHTWASRLLKPKLQGCIYRFSQAQKNTGQDGSRVSSQPSPYRSGTPSGDCTGSTEVFGDKSEPASCAPASSSNLFQTPKRQQLADSKHLHEPTPIRPTSGEPMPFPHSAQPEAPRLTDETFRGSVWDGAKFHFDPYSPSVQSSRPDRVLDSLISLSAGGMSSDLPIRGPLERQQCTPTSSRSAIRQGTPRTQRRVSDNGSPPAASARPDRSTLGTPVAMGRTKDTKDTASTEAEHVRAVPGGRKGVLSSPVGDDIFEHCTSQTEKVTKKPNLNNTTLRSDSSRMETGIGVIASSSAIGTQGLIGQTTGEMPGQKTFLSQLSTSMRELLTGSTISPSGLPIDVTYPTLPKLSLKHVVSEVHTLTAKMLGHPQPTGEDSRRIVDTRQYNELDSKRNRMNGTQRHKVHVDRIPASPNDADTTPRPRMKNAGDTFNLSNFPSKTGPPNDQGRDTSTWSRTRPFNQPSTQDNANNTISSANEDISSTTSDSASCIGAAEGSKPGANDATTYGDVNEDDLSGPSQSSNQGCGTSSMTTTNESVCSSVLSEASNHKDDPDYEPSQSDDSCSDA